MLFAARFWEPIRTGRVTLTFRTWKRRQVVPGRRYRTAAGTLEVLSIEEVDRASITDDDARRAGFESLGELVDQLHDEEPERTTFRIEFLTVDEPDPRDELAAAADLDDDDRTEIDRRLDRLDRAAARGAWTRETLKVIADHPARRAGDLAPMLGVEKDRFKTDVRKLKNLGLTLSLKTGYRLSPRGAAYLERDPTG